MAGFLGKAPLASDIGFLLEIAVTVALMIGRFSYARKRILVRHALVFTFAVSLHALSVAFVMIPSFARSFSFVIADLTDPVVITTLIHIPLGLFVLITAVFLISQWRFRPPDSSCYRRTRLMRPLWWLWLLSLAFGFSLYAVIAVG